MTDKKWVYLFDEVKKAEDYAGSWDGVRALIGGKGANLAEMTRIGVPVPPFFTITTEACNAYQVTKEFPEGMWSRRWKRCTGSKKPLANNLVRQTIRF